MLNIAQSRVREALEEPNPRTNTSEHCIDCRARHACRTLQHAAQTFTDFSMTAELVEMPAESIGQELNIIDAALQRLEARRTGIAAQAEALLRAGKPVALYHMEPGQSRLIYRDDVNVDEVVGLGELCNVNLRKPQSKKDLLVTPTQAIELGIDGGIMSKYAHRPPAAYKLARDNSITARKVFSK
jgi:hypothetical protein